MTLKIHHLVAATDDKTDTQLTNIYAETYEQAVQEARLWHAEHFPELLTLTIKAQPQGFQAGFRRLPGAIEETERQGWRIAELLDERGMTRKQLAQCSGVSYRTVQRLCTNPFHAAGVQTLERIADALALPVAHLQTTVIIATPVRVPREYKERIHNESSATARGAARSRDSATPCQDATAAISLVDLPTAHGIRLS